MSPPTTRTIGSRAAAKPGRDPASGPSKATGSWTSRHAGGEVRGGVRARRRRGSRSRPGVTPSMACRGGSGHRSRSASLSRPKRLDRPPARTRPVTRRAVMARSPAIVRPVGPGRGRPGFGAGSRAGRGPPGSPSRTCGSCRSRREGRRGERRGRGEPERGRGDLVVCGRRVGEVGVEHDDPAGPLELADPRPVGQPAALAASASGGGAATAERRSRADPSRRATAGSGPAMLRVAPGRAHAGPVTDQAPIGDESVDRRLEAAVTAALRPIVARRRSAWRPSPAHRSGRRWRRPRRRPPTASRHRRPRRRRVRHGPGQFRPPADSSTPCKSRRASAIGRAVTGSHGRGQATDPLRRLTPPRDPARRRDIERPSPRRSGRRRMTVAAPTGRPARPRAEQRAGRSRPAPRRQGRGRRDRSDRCSRRRPPSRDGARARARSGSGRVEPRRASGRSRRQPDRRSGPDRDGDRRPPPRRG